MSTGGNNASTDEKPNDKQGKVSYNVVYQKVLRPRTKEATSTFLLDLITYLQSMFELPDGLPMPYESQTPDEHDGEGFSSDNRAILVIDSPLADDPTQARLEVEVVGIFPETEDDKSKQLVPTMAMVAMKKMKPKNGIANSVTEGLFSASEKRIIQSLDRGLQDLEEGRISIPSSQTDSGASNLDEFNDLDDDGIETALKRIGYQNTINAASSDVDVTSKTQSKNFEIQEPKNPISIERDDRGNVIIDSTPTSSPKPKKKKPQSSETRGQSSPDQMNETVALPSIQKSKMKTPHRTGGKTKLLRSTADFSAGTISEPNRNHKAPPGKNIDNEIEDYAIRMARQQAEALMKTARIGSSTSSIHGTINISGGDSEFAIQAAKRAAARLQSEKRPSKSSLKGQEEENDLGPYSQLKSDSKSRSQTTNEKPKAQDLSNNEMFMKLQSIANKAKRRSWNKTISKKGTQSSQIVGGEATAALKSVNNGEQPQERRPEKSDDEIREDITKIARENEQVQDLLKSATDMLPNDGDEDLSPEELLERVLKFGDQKEKEEKPGYGFVEGAIGKAKDLLKSEQTAEINRKEFAFKEKDYHQEMKRKAEEAELRKIFAAGQATAQDKLSKPSSQPSDIMKPPISEQDIDDLIAADETVPLNARVLDEELAEFEIRMSRSQGEVNDGPTKNKMFDVFSGPEVYNPNVDPATAVNWPGAKEGTRTDVKLAKELETALKQAKFAAAVLTQMREKENDLGIRYFVGEREISADRVNILRKCVEEAVKAGLIEDPEILLTERSRLQMLIDELASQPEERLEEIALNYKDLLLSDNFIDLVRERMYAMAQRDLAARQDGTEESLRDIHAGERAIMINLVKIAQGLVKEAQALGAELEVSMLEIIRSICEVAMDPSHTTEEETAVALTDAVRDMRPLLDDAFVAYLKYAIAEEEASLERSGVVDDPEHNRWLFVLKIVQEGVYAELSRGVKRYIDHIGYVLRMKTKAERRDLLAKLIEVMPTMDVRPFVKVIGNIVSSLGTSVKGDFSDGIVLGDMTNKLLQLQRDVDDLLPPDKLNERSKDADNWAATQRRRLLERQNLTRQRLRAARETGSIDPDKVISSGEYDRFD
eukprot:CCRYP_009364-RA/>CCRYP_009364-RA protein AED:0.08 eAED:0.08 QI:0/0/0/1/1/1/3/0/1109